MKKVIYWGLAMICMAWVVACASGGSTPSDAARKYAGYLQSGNFEKFVDGIYYGDKASSDEVKEAKKMFLSVLKEKGAKQIEKNDGIKNLEVLSEEMAEDGQSAIVELKTTYGNGKEKKEEMSLVRVGKDWKMKIKK